MGLCSLKPPTVGTPPPQAQPRETYHGWRCLTLDIPKMARPSPAAGPRGEVSEFRVGTPVTGTQDTGGQAGHQPRSWNTVVPRGQHVLFCSRVRRAWSQRS